MANINLYNVWLNKKRKFGVSSSTTFQSAFVEAVNKAFADFNSFVFSGDTLEYIENFSDIVSTQMDTVASLAFDADSEAAFSGREYWSVEYKISRKSATNGMTDTITDDASNVVITIADGVLALVGDSISFTATLPDIDLMRILISSNKSGIRVLVGDESADTSGSIDLTDVPDIRWSPDYELDLSFTLGDSDTSQSIGTVSARLINGISGLGLLGTTFYSATSKVEEWLFDEGTGASLVGEINGYIITATTPVWLDVYVESSCVLDRRFQVHFDAAVEYYLQEGGEWAIEPDPVRERKWLITGVRGARRTNQQQTTYTNPLGI